MVANEVEDEWTYPDGWKLVSIRDVFEIEYGRGLVKSKRDESGNVPVYGSSGVVGYHSQALIDSPCIVVGRKGAVGQVYHSKVPCWPIDTTYYIRPPEGLSLGYVRYALEFMNLGALDKSTAIPGLNRDDFYSQLIPIPPTNEQYHIVRVIETQFTRLDAAVAALQRAQATLQRYKASVLKAACEGRLLPQETVGAIRESPDYEPADQLLARILAQRRAKWEEQQWQKEIDRAKKQAAQAARKAAGLPARIRDLTDDDWQHLPEDAYAKYLPKNDDWKQKYKELEPPDTEDLPELPEGWAWARFEQLTSSFRSGSSAVPFDEPSGYPILRSSSVRPLKVDYKAIRFVTEADSQNSDSFLREGDLLFTRLSGSLSYVGNCALVRGSKAQSIQYPDRLFRAQLVEQGLGEYVEMCFASPRIRKTVMIKAKSTAGHQRISMGGITEQVFPLPPFVEQHRIVEEVERRLSVVSSLEAAVQANLRRTERLRQSILKRAFEGRLVPQDPNDEPASVLLERIRAGREAGERAETGANRKMNHRSN